MDERTMMQKIAAGDEAALHVLLRRYGPLIRYILRPILPDSRDREECWADISVKLWQTAADFDAEKGTLKAWLTAISRNAALNRARSICTDVPLEEAVFHADGSAEEELLRHERRPPLASAVAPQLPAERTLFYRHYYYFQPNLQIAAELGLTERAVEGRLYRLRQKLRQQLGGDFCE